jgi:cytochrome c oxidase cbb3-type subunit 2
MAFNIHQSHRLILLLPLSMYVALVIVCAVIPAQIEARREAQAPKAAPNPIVERGRAVFLQFNCTSCHTQQVRGDEHLALEIDGRRIVPVLAADRRFSTEATTAAHYDHESPALLGTQRTGPDLIGVGERLPGQAWHHWHLYNPRSVSPDSTMEAYPHLYRTDVPADPRHLEQAGYEKVERIQGLGLGDKPLWATPDAVALVEYLLSLQGVQR